MNQSANKILRQVHASFIWIGEYIKHQDNSSIKIALFALGKVDGAYQALSSVEDVDGNIIDPFIYHCTDWSNFLKFVPDKLESHTSKYVELGVLVAEFDGKFEEVKSLLKQHQDNRRNKK